MTAPPLTTFLETFQKTERETAALLLNFFYKEGGLLLKDPIFLVQLFARDSTGPFLKSIKRKAKLLERRGKW